MKKRKREVHNNKRRKTRGRKRRNKEDIDEALHRLVQNAGSCDVSESGEQNTVRLSSVLMELNLVCGQEPN